MVVCVMRFGVLVLDGCLGSGVASILDIFRVSQFAAPAVDSSIPPIEFDILGSRRLTSSEGMRFQAAAPAASAPDYDLVVVPALAAFAGDDIDRRLASAEGRRAVDAVRDVDLTTTTVAAACTGVFTVASAGILDRREATTSWFLAAAFAERFPEVRLELETMVVADGPVITAGAAFAHIDLALTLVRRISPVLATRVAQTLLIDERPSQGAYMAYDHLDHDDDLVRTFERHVREHLADPLDVRDICATIGTSRRTLERRTRRAVAASPNAIIQRLRVERATHLRRTTNLSLEAIAPQVGYASADTLRALLRRTRSGR